MVLVRKVGNVLVLVPLWRQHVRCRGLGDAPFQKQLQDDDD